MTRIRLVGTRKWASVLGEQPGRLRCRWGSMGNIFLLSNERYEREWVWLAGPPPVLKPQPQAQMSLPLGD